MAIKLPFKLDAKTVALILSFLLNILGGTGTVQPLVGDECSPAPAAPAIEAQPILSPAPGAQKPSN